MYPLLLAAHRVRILALEAGGGEGGSPHEW